MKELVTKKIDEFRAALTAGLDGIVRAAEIYVQALDDDPRNEDLFHSEFSDWIPPGAWAQFEAIGRKWMHPRLIMGSMATRKAGSCIKRLSYSQQERVFNNERFDLLTSKGDTLKASLLECTPSQAEQLCGYGNIRTLAEQKAWLVEQERLIAARASEKPDSLPYTIQKGKVHFRRGTVLNKKEMNRILREM